MRRNGLAMEEFPEGKIRNGNERTCGSGRETKGECMENNFHDRCLREKFRLVMNGVIVEPELAFPGERGEQPKLGVED